MERMFPWNELVASSTGRLGIRKEDKVAHCVTDLVVTVPASTVPEGPADYPSA